MDSLQKSSCKDIFVIFKWILIDLWWWICRNKNPAWDLEIWENRVQIWKGTCLVGAQMCAYTSGSWDLWIWHVYLEKISRFQTQNAQRKPKPQPQPNTHRWFVTLYDLLTTKQSCTQGFGACVPVFGWSTTWLWAAANQVGSDSPVSRSARENQLSVVLHS